MSFYIKFDHFSYKYMNQKLSKIIEVKSFFFFYFLHVLSLLSCYIILFDVS